MNHANIFINIVYIFIVSLTIISLFSIEIFAATLNVSLDRKNNLNEITTIIVSSAAGGVQSQQFKGDSVHFTVTTGKYSIILQLTGNSYHAQILNPIQCDEVISTEDDQESCKVKVEDQTNPREAIGSLEVLATGEVLTLSNLTFPSAMEDKENDPPFRTCAEIIRTFENTKSINNDTDRILKVVQKPSSAQYFINGLINIEQLKKITRDNGRNDITIQIINDLNSHDSLTINPYINEKYVGQIIHTDNRDKKDVLPFYISNINTECKYIIFIQPNKKLDKSQENQWIPITKDGKYNIENSSILSDSDYQEIETLSGSKNNQEDSTKGSLSSHRNNQFSKLSLNPPFGSCTSNVAASDYHDTDNNGNSDNFNILSENIIRDASFAEYRIIGNLQHSILSENENSDKEKILIKITNDLNLSPIDSKITNNENPFLKVELILNPEQPSGKKIDFLVKEISYTCHGYNVE